jgi:hypothetical protein
LSVSATVLDYINAFKWPVVVTGGIYYFRKPFAHILDRVSTSQKGSITGPAGTSITWESELKEVDNAVAHESAQLPGSVATLPHSSLWHATHEPDETPEGTDAERTATDPVLAPDDIRDLLRMRLYSRNTLALPADWTSLESLALINPQAAVVLSFTRIEVALREVAKHLEPEGIERKSAGQLTRMIGPPEDIQKAVARLYRLRNEVIHHDIEPDTTSAEEYVQSAKRLYEYIELFGQVFGPDERPGDQPEPPSPDS